MVPLRLTIDDTFYRPEYRNGYLVSSEMKKVWAVELDLLNEFARVCSIYSLKWFAHAGTMLGAVRHHGFIPWDDDIDVVMPREDYRRLCSIAPTTFEHPYFFQTEDTDRFFCRGFARLRNSDTTAIQYTERAFLFPFNQGIFIDIFPMDSIPDDSDERKQYYKQAEHLHAKSRAMRYYVHFYIPNKNNGFYKMVNHSIKHLYYRYITKPDYTLILNEYNALLASYNGQKTECVGESIIPPLGRWIWKRKWVEKVCMLPFEMLSIPVPIGYDECLSSAFGADWRIPKHVPTLHGGVLFDVDNPYSYYIESKKNQ